MQLSKGALTTMVFSRRQAQNVQNDQADNVLRSFKEWLGREARAGRLALHPDANEYLDKPDDTTGTEFYFSPSIAPSQPSIDLNYQQTNFHSDRIASSRRSIGRQVFRTLAWGFIVVVMVSAALAWQSSDDQTREMVRVWGKSLSPLLSVHDSRSPRDTDLAAEPASTRAAAQDIAFPQAPVSQSIQALGPSEPILKRQLETLASNLSVIRDIVEKLTDKQEQMARDIATLQATEQNVSQKISLLPQSPASSVPPRKNERKVVHSKANVQPVSVPLPVPAPAAGKPLPLH
jgi:hypothetical protein